MVDFLFAFNSIRDWDSYQELLREYKKRCTLERTLFIC